MNCCRGFFESIEFGIW
ncbi:hypothetical protein Gohar_005928 [Gossypium harknessii]|uniref:Uncharacterized protein n=1 Tax=Gossypium harknessii TaxID=34285 RepID=A0A7J9H9I6_9ROSI|nr:hypothetical protein [Gossypium harknessii]